jgi:hypothetical protein
VRGLPDKLTVAQLQNEVTESLMFVIIFVIIPFYLQSVLEHSANCVNKHVYSGNAAEFKPVDV